MCSCFNAGTCTGGGLCLTGTYPRHAEYPSLLNANSQVAHKSPYIFCCVFTSLSPEDFALAKDSPFVRVLGFFLLLNLKSVCKGIKQ